MTFNIVNKIGVSNLEDATQPISIAVNMNDSIMKMKEMFVKKLSAQTRNQIQSLYDGEKNTFTTQRTTINSETNEPLPARRPTDFTCRIRGHNPFEEAVPFGDPIPIGPGALLGDETRPMKEFRGLCNGDILYLEAGQPLLPEHIAIQYFVIRGNLQTQAGGQGTRDSVGKWIHVHKKATTAQTLKAICGQIDVSTTNHRLRQVAGSDSGKLCIELDRSITMYVTHGETLLIEEGAVPRKGEVTLNMHLFVTSEERLILEKWENEQKKAELVEYNEIVIGATTSTTADKNEASEDAFYRSRRKKRECIHGLEPFDVVKTKMTLLALKTEVSQHKTVLKLAQIRGIELSDPKQLRIRELDKVSKTCRY